MPIARNNNRTIDSTAIGYCFERFGFLLLFSDLRFASGPSGDPTSPNFILNLNGGH